MTAVFEVLNGDVTVRFEYTADLTKVQTVISDAAHRLWDTGAGYHGTKNSPILFDDISNQQKVDIVDQYVKQEILALARNYLTTISRNAAVVQAELDANDIYDLGT